MKKLTFTLLAFFAIQLGSGQTTYYWVGGTNPAAGGWNNPGTNWNTSLDGSGSPRTTSATTDILVFDGSNVGGATPTTGPVTVSATSQTIGKLILQNNADVAITRNGSGGTTTITIGDDPSGNDLVVFDGSTLRLKGLTGSIALVLASNAGNNNVPPATTSATAMIFGNIVIEEGNNTYQNRFTARYPGVFVFASGSTFTTLAPYAYYPFGTKGSSTTPVDGSVVFEAGSSYYYNGGLSPFGSNSTSFITDFEPGSKFYFRAAPAANMFGSRSYADVVVENNATVTSNGSLIRIDSLRIESGATFITNTSGVTPIHGNIIVNGTLKVPDANPDRDNKVVLVGSLPQTISGTGTVSLADFIISDISDVTLQKSIMVDTITHVIGTLNPNGNSITGAGTMSIKAPASLNVNANLNVDSFIVKNITDFTGIEIGMSVTGAGVQPNTVITNTSTTNGTITLSKEVTGTVTYASAAVPLNIFNGQGIVLPVKFGNFTAAVRNNTVKLQWQVYTEENVDRYIIERSANGREFTSIGSVNAEKLTTYAFDDRTPLTGVAYYRIKAVDIDGKFGYSTIAKISFNNTKAELSAYPNPVNDRTLNISLSGLNKDQYTVVLVNSIGQAVLSQTLGTLEGSLSRAIELPASLQTGVYHLLLKSSSTQLHQQVIIK